MYSAAALSLWLALCSLQARPWTVTVPPSMPDTISQGVSPQFPAFGFEPAAAVGFFQDPTTKGVNQFSVNLVESITKRTGGRAIFRLDSDPLDRGYFNESLLDPPAVPVGVPYLFPANAGEQIGPNYFPTAAAFPNVDFIVGVPFARVDVANTIRVAEAALSGLGKERIVAFEVGNEPDGYGGVTADNGTVFGPPTYLPRLTNQTYTEAWVSRAANLTSALNLTATERIFQSFSLAAASYDNPTEISVQKCFSQGIDQSDMIKIVSRHWYAGSYMGYDALGPQLMNHSHIAAYLDSFAADIPFLNAYNTSGTTVSGTRVTTLESGLPLVIGEIGDLLGGGNYSALNQEQAVLGTALWQLDVNLYAMHLGISMINWQQNLQTGHDMWLPIGSVNATPTVFSLYYANLFAADFIGDTGGTTQVARLDVGDAGGSEAVQAYAAWVNGTLSRFAIINFEVWDAADGTTRPAEYVELDGLPQGVYEVDVTQLTSPLGAHANSSTMTYAGSQWTYESLGTEVTGVRDDTASHAVQGGTVSIAVNASSAVMVWLKY